MAAFTTYLDFFMKLRHHGDLKDSKYLCDVIVGTFPNEVCQEDQQKIIIFSRNFVNRLGSRWTKASRSLRDFLRQNIDWLETEIKWPTSTSVDMSSIFGEHTEISGPEQECHVQSSYMELEPSTSTTADVGTSTEIKKRKPFTDLTNKQKKRRSASIIDENSEEELCFFYSSKLKENGKNDLLKIINYLNENLDAVYDVSKFLFHKKTLLDISEDKSLALSTSLLDLSKYQYLSLRRFLKEENCTLLPSYHKILSAKKRCYPANEDIQITERGASIKLQALLDHTAQRIIINLNLVLSPDQKELKMIWKWGLDGSSSQSNYKQKPLDPDFDDSSVVMISAVPLRLVDNTNLMIWENPSPSSTQYCRPVKFTFTSETADFINSETLHMQQQIAELRPTKIANAEIAHEMHMTMVDGKVVNIVAEVPSSATCPICLAKPSDMNNLDLVRSLPVRERIYQYGISSLHMKIRCMECLLHISYNKDFERWSARGEFKNLKMTKKAATQKEFREQTGLLIDIVKQGFGTSNDGNTARRFFRDYQQSSKITGLDENLILRFAIILQAISSEKRINIPKFRSYCKDTADLYVQLYGWYYMPTSVHKLLIHGADICSHFSILPIGIMSEEASESRNKDFRKVRESHTRKMQRVYNNTDILHSLLITSDPYISKLRPKYHNKAHKTLPEVMDLLEVESLNQDMTKDDEELIDIEGENLQDPLI